MSIQINMKAVIVDIKGKYAVALSDDGSISKIRNRNYEKGQVFEMREISNLSMGKLAKISAIAALFLIVVGIGVFTYFHESAYVSLDVNPSIEFSLNMYDRVLTAKGVNDDGEQVLDSIGLENLSNKTIDEAIKLTVQNIADQGYFDSETTGDMIIAVSGKDLKKSAELAGSLKQVSEMAAKEKNVALEVEAEGVGRERVEQAKSLGITPGKLRLIEKLKNSAEDPQSINVEDWKDKSVKEIQKAVRARRIQNLLSDEQKALIEPALETFKNAVAKAGEDFNAAFEAIKADYTQQINALKEQYADGNELRQKLSELRIKMLDERRAEMAKLSDAVKTAKEEFLKATADLGLSEEVLLQYIKVASDEIMNPNEGYKDFLSLFCVAERNRENANNKTESKTNNGNNNGNNGVPADSGSGKGNGNGNNGAPADNGNGKGNGNSGANLNSQKGENNSSWTQSAVDAASSEPEDNGNTTGNKQNAQSDQQSDRNKNQHQNNDKQANGKGN